MRTLEYIFYTIGAILIIVACCLTGVVATWITGGIGVLALLLGCVFQYSTRQKEDKRLEENQKDYME